MSLIKRDYAETTNDYYNFFDSVNTVWFAHQFLCGEQALVGYTCNRVSVHIRRHYAAIGGPCACYLYSTVSDLPSALLGTATNTVAISDFPIGTADWVNFNFAGVALTNGVYYFIVLRDLAYDVNDTGAWEVATGTAGRGCRSTNGSVWVQSYAYKGMFQTYEDVTVGGKIQSIRHYLSQVRRRNG